MVGAPYGMVQRVNLVLLGFAMFAFGFTLHRAYPGSGFRHWFAPSLMLANGLGRMGEGIFAWTPTSHSLPTNTAHMVSGMVAVLSMILVVFAAYWMMRASGVSRMLQRYTLGTGALFVLMFIVIGPVGLGPRVPLGLGQRAGFLIWFLWVVIVASSLLKDSGRSDHPPI